MTNPSEFIQNFLEHAYDPVKAHEYYLRTRKLQGKASAVEKAGAKEYESHVVGTAQKRLNADLKKQKVTMNPRRRIGAAEQKLIRAKSLAARIKDPDVKADMLRRIAATERKLRSVKKRHLSPRKKTSHHTPRRPVKTGVTKKVDPRMLKGRSHENQQ